MNIWAIIPLVTSIAYIVLLVVTLQSVEKRVNKVFAFYLAVAATWSFTSFMLHLDALPSQTLFWNQVLVVAMIWSLITYYQFIQAYTNRPARIWLYAGYALLLALGVLSLSGNIVQYSYVSDSVLYHELGASLYFIGGISLAYITAVMVLLVRKYRHSIDPIDRNRTMYLMSGWSIWILLTYTNLIPAVAGFPLDHIGSLINALIISYAISRLHLLDIKLVARRGLAYFILLGSLIGLYAGAIFLVFRFLPNQPVSSMIVFAAAMAILLALAARPLRYAIQERVDRLFYRGTYEQRQALLSFSSKMGNILKLEELAKEILPTMTKALGITQANLLLQDIDSGSFATQFTHSRDESKASSKLGFDADSPIVAWLEKAARPLDLKQIDSIPEFKGLWQAEKENLAASNLELLCPIKSHDKLIGIMSLGKKRTNGLYSHEDILLMMGMASQAGIIIENAQLYSQAMVRANTDGLTGLYNHRHFHERLEQEIARGSRFGTMFSLVMLDIDGFKAYNDTYGHLAGDQVLQKIGKYIKSSIRSIDTAFRYGGEEFMAILPETRPEDAYRVAERIRQAIEAKTSSRDRPVTASLGVASWPIDGIMREEIIAVADAAQYRAKQTGGNQTCLSSELVKPATPLVGIEIEARPRALSMIYTLAATIDTKDHYTYGHSKQVSDYAVAIAELLSLPPDRIATIRAAGLLHDIGKVGIPDSVLNKKGPLTDEEWEQMRDHPKLGVEILKYVIDLVNCLPAILHHHEHYDGSGYPSGLAGNNIPLEARILSIADAYDAITSPRPYREQLSLQQAIAELKRCAGVQFDPEMVALFCKAIEQNQVKKLEIK